MIIFRFFLLVLLAFGTYSVPNISFAADYSDCYNNALLGNESAHTPRCPSRQDAYTQALAACNLSSQPQYKPCFIYDVSEPNHGVRARNQANGSTSWRFWDSEGCAVGMEWYESLQRCDKSCSARNADLLPEEVRPVRWASYDGSSCANAIAECKYSIIGETTTRDIYGYAPGQPRIKVSTLYGGVWGYTGERCSPSDSPPPDDPLDPLHRPDQDNKPDCAPAGANQTYCIKPNGDHCYTSSAGRSICWRPDEQGVKTDKDILQERKNGDVAPNPPPNTTSQNSIQTESTSGGNQTTVTVNNYATSDGSSAGTSNSGESTDGNGVPGTSGGGGKDGDENGSTGGGDCDAPPVSSGDALLAQIARQAWETRCVIANRDAAQDQSAADVAAQGDGLDGVSESSIFDDSGDFAAAISETLIGGSVSQCSFGVNMELFGHPIQLPPQFWELCSWIGFLTVALAYIWVAQMLVS